MRRSAVLAALVAGPAFAEPAIPDSAFARAAMRPTLEFAVQDLADNFDANEVRARDETKGVAIIVRGQVDSVREGPGGTMQVHLRVRQAWRTVSLSMLPDERGKVVKALPGDVVRVECRQFRKVVLLNGERCFFKQTNKKGGE